MNPKMKKYIFGKRTHSHNRLNSNSRATNSALEKVHNTISAGGKILFISKKQASEAVAQLAKDTDQYFVNYRWLGGMLIIGELFLIQ